MAKGILGKGRHIVPGLWESAPCANVSLKPAYKETFAMAFLTTASLAERDTTQLRPHLRPRL